MSWTYTTLTAAIQDFSEYEEADFVASIPDFIRNAEERIFRTVELPCARKTATGNLTISQQTLTHGLTDFYWPLYFTITVSGAAIPLLNKEADWIVEAYSGANTAQPIYYATKSDLLFMFGPTPDSGYAYEITYHGLPESIVDAVSEQTWLGTHARNALLYGALVEASINMRQDTDVLTIHETHFREAIEQLADQGGYRIRKDAFRARDKRPID